MRINEFILNFVLNSTWQVVVIFAVASLASWLLRNGPARYRHTLWVVAMLASVVVPLLTATRFVPDFQTPIQTHATQTAVALVVLTGITNTSTRSSNGEIAITQCACGTAAIANSIEFAARG